MAVDMHERPGSEAIMIISKAVNATLLISSITILDTGLVHCQIFTGVPLNHCFCCSSIHKVHITPHILVLQVRILEREIRPVIKL